MRALRVGAVRAPRVARRAFSVAPRAASVAVRVEERDAVPPAAAAPAAPNAAPAAAERRADMARVRQMLRWHWLEPSARAELERFAAQGGAGAPPAWFAVEYEQARKYRTARSRLWTPRAEDLETVGAGGDLGAWLTREAEVLEEALEAPDAAERVSLDRWLGMREAERHDVLLQRVWRGMSPDARERALTRVAFECARRLGWRTGYSSGFPGETHPDELRALGEQGAPRTAARRALRASEEQRAWAAWQALTPAERNAEWDTAWQLRDRSLIYVDDAPTSMLLGSAAPRWYATPQRAGRLQFLPNMVVRLVRNHTPAGKPYDPWKATFRVPLHVHKHALRSYLLAVYGLRTTWARSQILRAGVVYDTRRKRRTTAKGRTYKKIEVGLLEPFVFPGLDREFMRTHMFNQEMMYEERRLLLKMTKGRRWRARKSVRDLSRALDRGYAHQNAGAPDEQPHPDRPTAQLLVRSGSVPTSRHSNILSLLSQQRAEREARIREYIEKQRAAGADNKDK